jgi:hypothetical protein
MSRLLLALFAVALLAPTAHAQHRQSYDVGDVDDLYVAVHGEVVVRQGRPAALRIEGRNEIVDKIEVSDRSGRLRIEYEQRGWLERIFGGSRDLDDEDAVTVYVTLPSIRALSAGRTTVLRSETPLRAPSMEITASGAANIDVEVDVDVLTLRASGAGDTTVRGTASEAEITASGAGTVRAEAVPVRRATAKASGAGTVRLHVTERLDAEASGAGTVHYRGAPDVSRSTSGAGSIHRVEDA